MSKKFKTFGTEMRWKKIYKLIQYTLQSHYKLKSWYLKKNKSICLAFLWQFYEYMQLHGNAM